MTKWHHLNCFQTNGSLNSVENITGFSLLTSTDQESFKNFAKTAKSLKRKAEKIEGKNDEIGGKKTNGGEIETGLFESGVKNEYKGITLLSKWKAFETVIFLERDEGLSDYKKIAAFDFDGCLAKTNVKRVCENAWSLMYDSIPEKLKSLHESGYKVVIFTNESNIDRWKNKRKVAIDSKVGRLTNFIKRVEVPIQVFTACCYVGEDQYRKLKIGMWRLMEKHFNSGNKIGMAESFLCWGCRRKSW